MVCRRPTRWSFAAVPAADQLDALELCDTLSPAALQQYRRQKLAWRAADQRAGALRPLGRRPTKDALELCGAHLAPCAAAHGATWLQVQKLKATSPTNALELCVLVKAADQRKTRWSFATVASHKTADQRTTAGALR